MQNHRSSPWLFVVMLTFVISSCRLNTPDEPRTEQSGTGSESAAVETVEAGDYTITGPYTHNNLTVFLIHGEDRLKGKDYLTLQEAMDQKKIVVHETQDVNELSVENTSDQEIFIQASDIVKGGQQDRVLANDLILPPHSGQVPIDAFCVEHGRWQQRGAEDVAQFSSSNNQLASKELKMAAKMEKDQSKVWDEVANTQRKLSYAMSAPVESQASESSLQLTLENEDVDKTAEEYMAALQTIIDGEDDIIGYAFAINGTVNSADVYASSTLFRKLWPKMLRASAIEAIGELHQEPAQKQVTVNDIKARLADAEGAAARTESVSGRVQLLTSETDNNVMFETRDSMVASGWVHRNYMAK
jgi:hypothetical protein